MKWRQPPVAGRRSIVPIAVHDKILRTESVGLPDPWVLGGGETRHMGCFSNTCCMVHAGSCTTISHGSSDIPSSSAVRSPGSGATGGHRPSALSLWRRSRPPSLTASTTGSTPRSPRSALSSTMSCPSLVAVPLRGTAAPSAAHGTSLRCVHGLGAFEVRRWPPLLPPPPPAPRSHAGCLWLTHCCLSFSCSFFIV